MTSRGGGECRSRPNRRKFRDGASAAAWHPCRPAPGASVPLCLRALCVSVPPCLRAFRCTTSVSGPLSPAAPLLPALLRLYCSAALPRLFPRTLFAALSQSAPSQCVLLSLCAFSALTPPRTSPRAVCSCGPGTLDRAAAGARAVPLDGPAECPDTSNPCSRSLLRVLRLDHLMCPFLPCACITRLFTVS